jgi:hypothetical protein
MAPVGALYRPSDFVDRNLAGRSYLPTDQLAVAPFMAGSLRRIMLAPEFSRLPRVLKQQLKHLSFLMHLAAKYDNFSLIFKHHSAILEDIHR